MARNKSQQTTSLEIVTLLFKFWLHFYNVCKICLKSNFVRLTPNKAIPPGTKRTQRFCVTISRELKRQGSFSFRHPLFSERKARNHALLFFGYKSSNFFFFLNVTKPKPKPYFLFLRPASKLFTLPKGNYSLSPTITSSSFNL